MPIRTALVSVSDKSGLVPFARAPRRARRAHPLERRDGQGARSRGRRRRDGRELHGLARGHGRPREDAAPARPRRHPLARRAGRGRPRAARRRARSTSSSSTCTRSSDGRRRSGVDPRAHRREHRHRRAVDGPLRGEEPRARHGRVRPRRLRRASSTRSTQHGDTSPATRAELAAKAFAHTAAYDAAISGYLSSREADGTRARFPHVPHAAVRAGLRRCATARTRTRRARSTSSAARPPGSLARAESLGAGGKELSFNNLVDVDAALDAVREFERPGGGRRQAHEPVRRRRRRRRSPRRTARPARPTP